MKQKLFINFNIDVDMNFDISLKKNLIKFLWLISSLYKKQFNNIIIK
jgi:hypothetical protein